MPKMSGREVLKRLRGAGCGTPIRRLTAKGEIEDQIQNTCERLPDVQPDKLFDRFCPNGCCAYTEKRRLWYRPFCGALYCGCQQAGDHAEYVKPSSICFTVRFYYMQNHTICIFLIQKV